jgi:hypothetical protein
MAGHVTTGGAGKTAEAGTTDMTATSIEGVQGKKVTYRNIERLLADLPLLRLHQGQRL